MLLFSLYVTRQRKCKRFEIAHHALTTLYFMPTFTYCHAEYDSMCSTQGNGEAGEFSCQKQQKVANGRPRWMSLHIWWRDVLAGLLPLSSLQLALLILYFVSYGTNRGNLFIIGNSFINWNLCFNGNLIINGNWLYKRQFVISMAIYLSMAICISMTICFINGNLFYQ